MALRIVTPMVVAGLSVFIAPVGARSANSPWQAVSSNGISLKVPNTWKIAPFGSASGLCPSSVPAIHTGVPPDPPASSCPALFANQPLSLVTVGEPGARYFLEGKRTNLGSLPARLFIARVPTGSSARTATAAGSGSLVVAAAFPTVETEVVFWFSGPDERADLALALRILGSAGPTPTPAYGLVPAPPRVTAHLVLNRSTIASGLELNGQIVVTNRSGGPVDLNDFNGGCAPGMGAALVNPSWLPPLTVFNTACSAKQLVVPPGVSRWPVQIDTNYNPCRVAALWDPAVGACRAFRPLPPGRYQAALTGLGLALPPVKVASVTISR